jgi:hypothetical protein
MGVCGLLPSVFSYLSGVLSSLLLSPLTIPTQMFTGGRGSGSTAWQVALVAGDRGAALWGGVRGLCLRLLPAGGRVGGWAGGRTLRATGLQRGAQFAL